ncbi:MAG: ImmA/IrrE family metallo-endopeptidase [Gemmataceae bacterium]
MSASIRDKAWAEVEDWNKQLYARELPVSLEHLAKSYSVVRLMRAPLFSSAGLRQPNRRKSEFVIVINSDKFKDGNEEETEIPLTDGELRDLEPTIRFSIAHEIAHVVFLKASGKSARDAFFKSERTLDSLESECNRMARALLIPKATVIERLGDRVFDAPHVRSLIERFRVWPGMFVWRLQMHDLDTSFKNHEGLIAYAEEDREGIFIRGARVWGMKASARYAQRPRGSHDKPGDDMSPIVGPQGLHLKDIAINADIHEVLRQGQEVEVETSIPWHVNEKVPCVLSMAAIQQKPLKLLLAIKLTGEIIPA